MIALQIGGPEAEDQDCPERSRTDDIPSSTCKTVGENRSRPQPDETSVREMDAYDLKDLNSLIPAKNSLFLEIVPVNSSRELREK